MNSAATTKPVPTGPPTIPALPVPAAAAPLPATATPAPAATAAPLEPTVTTIAATFRKKLEPDEGSQSGTVSSYGSHHINMPAAASRKKEEEGSQSGTVRPYSSHHINAPASSTAAVSVKKPDEQVSHYGNNSSSSSHHISTSSTASKRKPQEEDDEAALPPLDLHPSWDNAATSSTTTTRSPRPRLSSTNHRLVRQIVGMVQLDVATSPSGVSSTSKMTSFEDDLDDDDAAVARFPEPSKKTVPSSPGTEEAVLLRRVEQEISLARQRAATTTAAITPITSSTTGSVASSNRSRSEDPPIIAHKTTTGSATSSVASSSNRSRSEDPPLIVHKTTSMSHSAMTFDEPHHVLTDDDIGSIDGKDEDMENILDVFEDDEPAMQRDRHHDMPDHPSIDDDDEMDDLPSLGPRGSDQDNDHPPEVIATNSVSSHENAIEEMLEDFACDEWMEPPISAVPEETTVASVAEPAPATAVSVSVQPTKMIPPPVDAPTTVPHVANTPMPTPLTPETPREVWAEPRAAPPAASVIPGDYVEHEGHHPDANPLLGKDEKSLDGKNFSMFPFSLSFLSPAKNVTENGEESTREPDRVVEKATVKEVVKQEAEKESVKPQPKPDVQTTIVKNDGSTTRQLIQHIDHNHKIIISSRVQTVEEIVPKGSEEEEPGVDEGESFSTSHTSQSSSYSESSAASSEEDESLSYRGLSPVSGESEHPPRLSSKVNDVTVPAKAPSDKRAREENLFPIPCFQEEKKVDDDSEMECKKERMAVLSCSTSVESAVGGNQASPRSTNAEAIELEIEGGSSVAASVMVKTPQGYQSRLCEILKEALSEESSRLMRASDPNMSASLSQTVGSDENHQGLEVNNQPDENNRHEPQVTQPLVPEDTAAAFSTFESVDSMQIPRDEETVDPSIDTTARDALSSLREFSSTRKTLENVQPDIPRPRQNLIPKKPPSAEKPKTTSNRIRFRDPFPILKPPRGPRDTRYIVADHSIGAPVLARRWIKPTKTLKQLIVAAMGTSLVRRSNACGALKVLTQEKKNQRSLVRTDSFLSALIVAAGDDISSDEPELALDARTRAMTCLRNVCVPKECRAQVITHPGLLECLVKVMLEDCSEARVMACETAALLAKTPECRELMCQVDGMLVALANVLKGDGTLPGEDLSIDQADNGSSSASDDDSASGSSISSGDDDSASRDDGDEKLKHGRRGYASHRKQNESNRAVNLEKARTNACAALLHFSKHCSVLVSIQSVCQLTRWSGARL
jgi:hypothetical protein